jgi:hypothetical protein
MQGSRQLTVLQSTSSLAYHRVRLVANGVSDGSTYPANGVHLDSCREASVVALQRLGIMDWSDLSHVRDASDSV